MKPKKRKPAARKRREADHRCYYDFKTDAAWRRLNFIRTADQGREPEVTYWSYEPRQRAAEGGPTQ